MKKGRRKGMEIKKKKEKENFLNPCSEHFKALVLKASFEVNFTFGVCTSTKQSNGTIKKQPLPKALLSYIRYSK